MKNFMKKITIALMLVITFALCFAFVGCGEKECYSCNNGELLNEKYYWKDELSTTATCTQAGTTTIQCIYCKRTAKIEVSALGHDYKVTKDEATCLQDGNTYYACSRKDCTSTKTEFSKASSAKHKWVVTYSKETVNYEYKDYKCSVCNQTKTEKTKVDMGTKLKSTEEKFYYATGAAVQIVKGELKYPASAKFIKESQMEVHHNYLTSNYYIEGAVSAPNAFGVYTNYYFIVKTKIRVSGSKYTWYDYDCILDAE